MISMKFDVKPIVMIENKNAGVDDKKYFTIENMALHRANISRTITRLIQQPYEELLSDFGKVYVHRGKKKNEYRDFDEFIEELKK